MSSFDTGALNVSDLILRNNLDKIPKTKNLYVYCQEGFRAYLVSRNLEQRGYNVLNLTGGYKLYEIATATPEKLKKISKELPINNYRHWC